MTQVMLQGMQASLFLLGMATLRVWSCRHHSHLLGTSQSLLDDFLLDVLVNCTLEALRKHNKAMKLPGSMLEKQASEEIPEQLQVLL